NGWYILLCQLLLKVFGPTDERIIEALAGYDKVVYLEKAGSSGAEDIMIAAEVYDIETLRMTGVNTNSCIAESIRDLVRYRGLHRIARIEVVREACNTEYGDRHEVWGRFPKSEMIELI